MTMNMISAHHNYDDGYIGLANLSVDDLPDRIWVEGHELLRKSEFHVSLLCIKKIAPLINIRAAEKIEAELVEEFKDFIKMTPLATYTATDEYRLVKRDSRVTLVQIVTVPGIDDLFAHLEKKYKTKLPVQVTHITLYTLQPGAGIGIFSQDELERDAHVVEVPLQAKSKSTSSHGHFPTFKKLGHVLTDVFNREAKSGFTNNLIPTLVVIGIPFLGWALGALVNPIGWASGSPGIVMIGMMILLQHWMIAFIVFVTLLLIARYASQKVWNSLILTVSVLYASFIFYIVATADESEFA